MCSPSPRMLVTYGPRASRSTCTAPQAFASGTCCTTIMPRMLPAARYAASSAVMSRSKISLPLCEMNGSSVPSGSRSESACLRPPPVPRMVSSWRYWTRAPSLRPSPISLRITSPRWCVLMTMSRTPWATRFAMPYARMGIPHTGSIGLGRSAPTRPSRVDSPAQSSIARMRQPSHEDRRRASSRGAAETNRKRFTSDRRQVRQRPRGNERCEGWRTRPRTGSSATTRQRTMRGLAHETADRFVSDHEATNGGARATARGAGGSALLG